MAYWCATKRGGQKISVIKRFDPRFWTVNFPRPVMAGVTTTGPKTLRVDAVFYRQNDLAGLIWEAEDRHDHPLLSYETSRDFRQCTLHFLWRSSGVMPLNQIHGPVLTIEGRDAAGQARTWHVRLWNYATGSPAAARISLDFAALQGGFLLPQEGDPVWAGDVDRMFISLVAPGYTGADIALSTPVEAWVELSNIRCFGSGSVLDIGDAMVPEHGIGICSGYDDSYHITPARMLRNALHLGYRGAINHYVGMSHYFRLEAVYGGYYISLAGGALNTPCIRWHKDFAERAKALGYDIIWSLSYELFDAHCWNDWKQRAENGDPALTGWSPPSTLLSPAHSGAMGYLQAVARAFVAIARHAGLAVKFQIGEPWWWVMGDGRICLYDDAARAALGGNLVAINNVRGSMNAAQKTLLDQAGAILAASTHALAQAARTEAGAAGAQTLLLVYLPSVLDPVAPEVKRANVPAAWAYPAFDILQLEDYDWVTGGNRAATTRGVAQASARLGYPMTRQQYLSGFVLHKEQAAQWAEIEAAAQAGRERGTSRVFIWALPQVIRDGFVHFDEQEADMTPFDDVLFPIALGKEASVSPEFSTAIVTMASGNEQRNVDWADARLKFDAGPGVRSERDIEALITFFRARRGAARGFRFRDPFDHNSGAISDTPDMRDQRIGTGDAIQSHFPLVKYYGTGEAAQIRRITRPEAASVRVAVNAVLATGWTLMPGGVVAFTIPPAMGAVVTAGFRFDVPVRFAEDRLDVNRATFMAGEVASVPMVEIRE